MKTRITLIVAAMLLSGSTVMAQGLLGKLVSTASKVDNAASTANGAAATVDNAVNTATQVSGAVGKIRGLFGKKKNKEAEAAAAAAATQVVQAVNQAAPALANAAAANAGKVTVVSVAGADFATLKKLNEGIKACANVQDTKMKFSGNASTIEVTHGQSTDELLKLMQETSKDVFTEKNLEGLEDGKIALKLK